MKPKIIYAKSVTGIEIKEAYHKLIKKLEEQRNQIIDIIEIRTVLIDATQHLYDCFIFYNSSNDLTPDVVGSENQEVPKNKPKLGARFRNVDEMMEKVNNFNR